MQHNEYEIKTIAMEDMEKIRIARNAQIEVLRQTHEISKEEQLAYFRDVITPNLTKQEPEMILFSIFKNQEWIGYGGLVHIDWNKNQAEVSFLVDSKRALEPEIYKEDFMNFLRLLANQAFIKFKIDRLFTETYDFREQHIKILETFGFKIEEKINHSIMHRLTAGEYLNGI